MYKLSVRSVTCNQLRAWTGLIFVIVFGWTTSLVAGQYEGDIRLKGGNLFLEGTVEIYHAGDWGTVCDDSFDADAAAVVCRQLGLAGGTPSCCDYTASYYLPDPPPKIWLDGFTCQGSEARLADCSIPKWGFDICRHSTNPGVRCEIPPSQPSLYNLVWPPPQLPMSCGQVYGWGMNPYAKTYIPPVFDHGVAAVAAGYPDHSLALFEFDGIMRSWNTSGPTGSYEGQLPVPNEVEWIEMVDIKAGSFFSMALTKAGKVVVWGDVDYWGALNVPAAVQTGTVIAISTTYSTAGALLSTGEVITWGTASYGVTNIPPFARTTYKL